MGDESLPPTKHEGSSPVQARGIKRKVTEISDSNDDHEGEQDFGRDSWLNYDEHLERNSDEEYTQKYTLGFTPISTLSVKELKTQEGLDRIRRERGDADLEKALHFLSEDVRRGTALRALCKEHLRTSRLSSMRRGKKTILSLKRGAGSRKPSWCCLQIEMF